MQLMPDTQGATLTQQRARWRSSLPLLTAPPSLRPARQCQGLRTLLRLPTHRGLPAQRLPRPPAAHLLAAMVSVMALMSAAGDLGMAAC